MQRLLARLSICVAVIGFGVLLATSGARADAMTWPITNHTGYELDVRLYSPDHNWEWPGGTRVWALAPGRTIRPTFTCRMGERVCFGAWPRYGRSSLYWGVGRSSRNPCTNCCYYCFNGVNRGNRLTRY